MRDVKYYVTNNPNLDSALSMIHEDARCNISDWIDELDDRDVLEILQNNYCEDLHTMDELDDVYSYMSVTQVLEELIEIDTSDEYFNSYDNVSGNDMWDVSGVDKDTVIDDLHEGSLYYDDYEYQNILAEEEQLIEAVTKHFKLYDTAKQLFNMAISNDIEQLVSVLWNMNNQ